MKKLTGIIIAVLAVAGIVLILATTKKKAADQAASIQGAFDGEVVVTETVTKSTAGRSFTSNGVTQAGSELNFVSETSGRVTNVYVTKGSRVAKGTPLLKIDSELLEADYIATKASYDALKKDEERFSRSFEAGGVTSQQLDNIRTQLIAAESRLKVSKYRLDNAVVKAPIAGTINNCFVETGALIAPNVPLFEIVNDSYLKVICNVSESKVRLLKEGARVVAEATDGSGKTFSGTVRNIGLKTDRGLNYPVEIRLDSDGELRIGMYLRIRFESDAAGAAIFIPRKAVVGSVLSAGVFVAKDGKAERREVRLGDMTGDDIEILSGLEEGEEIIVAGLMNVSDGCSISIVGK